MHSNLKTYKFILTLSIVCAFILSLTNSTLKEKQQYNIEVDRKKNVLKCSGIDIENFNTQEIVDTYNNSIKEKVITLDGLISEISLNDLIINENNSTGQLNYSYNDDKYLPIFEYWNDNIFTYYILPISGKGLWSTLYGYISLSNDFMLVKGITFFKHGETPGLGGEIENLDFQKQFIDKKIFDDQNNLVSINIMKPGLASGMYEVDGLSGATITCNGLSRFLKNDLNRYINFFNL